MLYKFLIHRVRHFYSYITFCIQGLTLIVRVVLIPKNVRKKTNDQYVSFRLSMLSTETVCQCQYILRTFVATESNVFFMKSQ